MTISLENEVVVVTGGATRIGRAIALECAASGASVAITFNHSREAAQQTLSDLQARSTPAAPEMTESSAQKFAAIQCDVSNSQDNLKLRNEVLRVFGKATSLVNNAAIFQRTPFGETDFAGWEKSFDDHVSANLKGPYLLSKLFGDLFVAQKKGCIVNIADIHGQRALKNYAAYCLSKAGVLSLTESLAKALAPDVRVNAICPGTILLPSQAQGGDEFAGNERDLMQRVPLARLGTIEEIAQAVVFLIGGPQFISGAVLPVDGAERLR